MVVLEFHGMKVLLVQLIVFIGLMLLRNLGIIIIFFEPHSIKVGSESRQLALWKAASAFIRMIWAGLMQLFRQ